jgi:hypothetical protein
MNMRWIFYVYCTVCRVCYSYFEGAQFSKPILCLYYKISVHDRFDANPDPDPTFHFWADPDLGPTPGSGTYSKLYNVGFENQN